MCCLSSGTGLISQRTADDGRPRAERAPPASCSSQVLSQRSRPRPFCARGLAARNLKIDKHLLLPLFSALRPETRQQQRQTDTQDINRRGCIIHPTRQGQAPRTQSQPKSTNRQNGAAAARRLGAAAVSVLFLAPRRTAPAPPAFPLPRGAIPTCPGRQAGRQASIDTGQSPSHDIDTSSARPPGAPHSSGLYGTAAGYQGACVLARWISTWRAPRGQCVSS